jgi:beta-lactam-binding protein with PASTA domain
MSPTLRPLARSAAAVLHTVRNRRGIPVLQVLRARSTRSRAALSALMLLGVLAVSAGTGYRASQTLLDSASTYLPNGHGVARVNGATGKADAQIQPSLAAEREQLETAHTDHGWYVRNRRTNKISKIDPARMAAEPLAPTGEFAANGKYAYVVANAGPGGGSVSRLDPHGGASAVVRINGKIVGKAVDSKGTAWILLADGRLQTVHGGEHDTAAELGGDQRLLLTLVHDRPVVVRGDARQVVVVEPGGKQRQIQVDLPNGKILESAPLSEPGALWLVVEPARRMLRIEVESGNISQPIALDGDAAPSQYGRPVEFRGRVYVPDYSTRQVLVFDATTGRPQRPLRPSGTGAYTVTRDGNRVWINDQYASTAIAVGPDGNRTDIDKGDSPGLARPAEDPSMREPTQPPTTPPSASPPPAIPGNRPPTSPAPGAAGAPPSAPPPARIPTATVPDVIGRDYQAACAELRAARLECDPVAAGQTGGGTTGSVIGTDPPAGSKRQERYVVVVRYRDRIEVPDLTGLTVAQACTEVRKLGLECLGEPQGLAADSTALNVVTGQQPAPLQRADTRDQVTVHSPDKIEVPSLQGTPIATACAQLASIGMATCRQNDLGLAPAGQTAGVVIRQTPAAGAGVAPADPVTLDYYGGTPVTVPSLVGMSPEQAQTTLAGLGLAPAPSPDEVTNQPNVVHSQEPVAGSPVAPGTQVRYVYEDAVPTPLYLLKRSGEQYYMLSTEQAVSGFSFFRNLGNVFPASSPPPGGATPVYRYRCDNACGPGTTYYYSMTNNAGFAPAWVNDGLAFYAYAGANRPAGAQEVWSLYDPQERSWVWAVKPSAAYDIYIGRGFTSNFNFSLGWVWP